MSRKLEEFLQTYDIEANLDEEVIFSARFLDEAGKPIPATVRPMSLKEYNGYQKNATKVGRHGKVDFDSETYFSTIIINHTVSPDFKNKETLEKAGCLTSLQYLNKVFNAGEIAELAKEIQRVSGFDDETIEDLKAKVKN